jgi:hypothetical protein
LYISPTHFVLLTKHRVVGLLLPFALGHTSRVWRVERRDEPLYKTYHSLNLIIRLRDGCEEIRLLSPILSLIFFKEREIFKPWHNTQL